MISLLKASSILEKSIGAVALIHFSPNYLPPANSERHLVYGAHMSEDRLSEDDCAVCGRWPPALRPTMRDAIFRVPLHEPVCDDCMVAFVTNVCELCEELCRLAKGQGR
jgi:hypothetical protein